MNIRHKSVLVKSVAMYELYENHLSPTKIEGSATYSNFREFNVKVEEAIAPIR